MARPVIMVITKEATSWTRVPVAMIVLRMRDVMSIEADKAVEPKKEKIFVCFYTDMLFHSILPSGTKRNYL